MNHVDLNEESKAMKYHLFKFLSQVNKAVLPKLYKKQDLAKMNKAEMVLAGWKRWVTFSYFDECEKRKNAQSLR